MNLDFSKLEQLTAKPPQAPTSPTEAFREGMGATHATEQENPTEANVEGVESLAKLQNIADAKRKEIERAEAICREYQRNIQASSQIQAEILKGARAGEDIYSLFLKAVRAISLMTENGLFYNQLEGDVRAIYGVGLQEAPALQMELQQARERLTKLRRAFERADGDTRDRLKRAITAHENRIRELEARQ